MAPSQQGVVGGGRSMSESDLREDEEDDEEEMEERRRRRRGQDRIRGLSYEQLDSLTMPLAPRRPPRTYPPPPGQLTRAPSQATMHMTTVPQSLVARQLGSRHHPTRSSLRHSRMLVLINHGRVPRRYLPGVVSRLHYGVFLCVTQILLGLLLAGLAIWKSSLQPGQGHPRLDWPLYSCLLTLASGWIGLVLVSCCRYYYPGAATQPCLFPIRTPSILLVLLIALLAALLSLVAGISHLLHLLTLHSAKCSWEQPAPVLESWPQSSCLCISPTSLWQEGHLLYPGLACPQVHSLLPPLLLSLSLANLLSSIACLAFMLLLSCSTHNLTFRQWRDDRKGLSTNQDCRTPMLPRNLL